MKDFRNRIALSDRHLCEAEERIAAQRVRVAKAAGEEREKAEALLETYLEIQNQMQVHHALLHKELRLASRSSPIQDG